jgi:hypothetical protein
MTMSPAGEEAAMERRSERWRQALRAFMAQHRLTPAEWARMAKLKNPNQIYNFLNSHSNSLGMPTLEQLARAVPGATVTEIIGETPSRGVVGQVLPIRVAAKAGGWRNTYEVTLQPTPELMLPPGVQADEGVMLLDREADRVYPENSYLGVQAFAALKRPLRHEDYVLVHRVRGDKHEVTVRQVQMIDEAGERAAQLVFPSTSPMRAVINLPWPYQGEAFDVDGDRVQIRGLVRIMMLLHPVEK